ncbi:hypothetical protein IE368CO2PC_02159 [Enterococcus faecalis]|uniref:DUF4950 domain-containing protein n=1 Tax=Enterococcus faecalis TaxID=1351 RepID=UPI0018A88655|nr:DUF4950 domain-containing protein [Enterococcus faecalis]MDB1619336.1 DUF4950 domain-containing protein [Enterococcus faecalis]CAC9708253.1 hypothetical protein IE368AEPC_00214 [Enterococcus faecalis]CAC9729960.1 hypothetical protein IE368AEGC_01212 [Enterococcus faecalis]CAC9730239.1 hypothetical protein IE368CO2GC_01168 [Enterococcus faecalis]CAC9732275.1 hypothetical protein IE368ANAPC_01243 [Enterococcus faecalis]
MKKIVFLGLSLLLLSACSNNTKKETNVNSSSTNISSSVKESSSDTKEKSQSSTSTASSVVGSSTIEERTVQASLNDFVGGWGIPQSDNLFFINADGTFSSTTQSNVPLQNLNFSVDANGNQTMSYVLNNTPGTLVKNADGTLAAGGQVYSYLGNITMEQLIERNNQGQQNTAQQEVQESENIIQPSTPEIIQQSPEPITEVYDQVRDGEGGRQVAERNGITLEKLQELNPGISGYMPGQSLRVK